MTARLKLTCICGGSVQVEADEADELKPFEATFLDAHWSCRNVTPSPVPGLLELEAASPMQAPDGSF